MTTEENQQPEKPENKKGRPQNNNIFVVDKEYKGALEEMKARVDDYQFKTSTKELFEQLFKGQDGDAALFVKKFKDKYVFDMKTGLWYYFNTHSWREDILNNVLKEVETLADDYTVELRKMELYINSIQDEELKKQTKGMIDVLKRRISSLHTLNYKKSVLEIASSGVDSLGMPGDAWDANPLLIGVRNGCVELDTGNFRDGQPEDYIKTVAPVNWKGLDAEPKAFKKFLYTIFDGNMEIIHYVQRLLGYSITGLTRENMFVLLWGEHGQNGKGTLLETIRGVLGSDMCVKLSSDFLMKRGMGKSAGAPDAETYALRGARIAFCSETDEKEKINTVLMKELSGGDTLSARPPFGRKQINFAPSHLIFILTNHKPTMSAEDEALWTRTHVLQFQNSFVEYPDPEKPYQKKRDSKLMQKLKDEYDYIFSYLVRGSIWYGQKGLQQPEELRLLTSEYRREQDRFQDFLDEHIVADPNGFFARKDLFLKYKIWSMESYSHNGKGLQKFYVDLEKKVGKHTRQYRGGPRGHIGYSMISGV